MASCFSFPERGSMPTAGKGGESAALALGVAESTPLPGAITEALSFPTTSLALS